MLMRIATIASSVFLLPDRCMLFTAMAGVPDLSAMSRSFCRWKIVCADRGPLSRGEADLS
jgi:hypothetical protein